MMNRVLIEHALQGGQTVQVVQGDLTVETSDAIVNAANAHLMHGGGVAGAIVRHGGPEIQRESDAWVREHGPVSHEQPAWTRAGKLPARFVIHAVGPVWGDGDEDAKLAAAIHGSLEVAEELGCKSLSLPALSTGIFGFPKERAAHVILAAIDEHFRKSGSGLQVVRIVLFDQETADAFLKEWQGRES